MNTPDSLYIHIPFCRKKCPYCNFYSDIYQEEIAYRYSKVIANQISALSTDFLTIYIGGGTPTVLNNEMLNNLVSEVRKHCSKDSEFTIEANPESIDEEKIALFLEKGVNRLSIGIQSFQKTKLNKLGRIHSAKEAEKAVLMAERMGLKNINIDLMFGVEEENMKDWQNDLKEAVNLPIMHISCYCLTDEKKEETLLFDRGIKTKVPQDHLYAKMYEYAIDYLYKNGFQQYEISNFCRDNQFCQHNLTYWHNNDYIGIGPTAVSYIKRKRMHNVADIREYIKKGENQESVLEFSEELDDLQTAKETAALKIRTCEGINFTWFKEKTGYDFQEIEVGALRELNEKQLIEMQQKNKIAVAARLTRKGLLFCDLVSSFFL